MNPEMVASVIAVILFMSFVVGFLVAVGFISYKYFFSAKKQKALARLLNARAAQVEASISPSSGEDK